MEQKLNEFLSRHGFIVDAIEGHSLLEAFLQEMQAGLNGFPSSLAMLPSFIDPFKARDLSKPVAVIDAGGTNLRAALIKFTENGSAAIEELKRVPMPGVEHEVTSEQFFTILADLVAPMTTSTEEIGFCFSYPAAITSDCDGRLLQWNKRIKAPEVVGRMVGAELANKLLKYGLKRRVTLLNDTVATLLAGVSATSQDCFAGYVGFILGTGTNTAYVEKNSSIGKIAMREREGRMAINVESGGFALAPRSSFDHALDAASNDPGVHLLEKMMTGAYLGDLGLIILRTAADEGLLTEMTATRIKSWASLSNKDLDDFCADIANVNSPFSTLVLQDYEKKFVKQVGRALYRRSAKLAAINLAAAIVRGHYEATEKLPICANLDGSTIFKTRTLDLRALLEEHLALLLAPQGVEYKLINMDEAPLIGAAVAALSRPTTI